MIAKTPSDSRGRHRFCFRLRTLLVGVTLVCLVLALLPYEAREYHKRKARAGQLVASLGGDIKHAGWGQEPSPGANWLSLVLGFGERAEQRWNVSLVGSKVTLGNLEQLRRCDWIRVLDLSNTQVDDEALDHVAGIAKLREIHLANTRVTDVGIAKLAALQRLVLLDVTGTAVTYDGLAKLEQEFPGANFQEQLALARMKPGPVAVHGFPRFAGDALELDVFPPTTVPSAHAIQITRAIVVSRRELEDLTHLSSTRHFASSGFGSSSADFQFLAKLPHLTSVTIDDTHAGSLTDDDLRWFGELPELTNLDLYGSRLTDDGFAHVTRAKSLEQLDVSGMKLTPGLLVHLRELPKLQKLHLNLWHRNRGSDRYGPVTDDDAIERGREGVMHLAAMPSLRELSVMGNLMTDDVLAPVALLKSLKRLKLNGRFISKEAADRLQVALPECNVDWKEY